MRYTPLAILDLQEIRGYIQDVLLNPEAGENVLANIAKSCAQLKEHPHMGIELRKKLNRENRRLLSHKWEISHHL